MQENPAVVVGDMSTLLRTGEDNMTRMVYAAVALVMATGAFAGPAAAEGESKQRFTIVFQNTQDEARIRAAGPITGPGTLYFVESTDNADGTFVETYRAEFRSGGVILTVSGGNESFDFDPATCVLHMVNTGTYVITDGTDALVGISGEGTFTFRLTQVFERGPDGCTDEGHGVGVAKLSGLSFAA